MMLDIGKKFSFALSLSIIIFAVVYLFFPVRYEVNDDWVIVSALSGKDGFIATPAGLYISQLFSYALHFLYLALPNIPWYGMSVYAGTLLGISLIVHSYLKLPRGNLLLYSMILIILVTSIWYVFSFASFTAAALLIEFGVILVALTQLRMLNMGLRQEIVSKWFLLFCFLFAFLLRWKLVLVALVFALPLLTQVSRSMLKQITPVLLVAVVVVIFDRLLFYYEADAEEFAEYVEYDAARAAFHDGPRGEFYGEKTLKALNAVNWEEDDYKFFKNWNIYDDYLFNIKNLETFLHLNESAIESITISQVLYRLQSNIEGIANGYMLFLLATVNLLLVVMTRSLNGRNQSLELLMIGVGVFGFFVMTYYRVVPRVMIPVMIFVISLGCVYAMPNKGSLKKRQFIAEKITKVVGLLSLILVIYFSMQLYRSQLGLLHAADAENKYKDAVYTCIDRRLQKTIFLISMQPTNGGVGIALRNPLHENNMMYSNLKFVPTGTAVNHPRYLSMLRSLSLDSGRALLNWAVKNNDNVLFVIYSRSRVGMKEHLNLWESYLSRNLGQGLIEMAPVFDKCNRKGTGLLFYKAIQAYDSL